MSVPFSGEHHESDTGTDRDARCTARQFSGEHHERAVEAAGRAICARGIRALDGSTATWERHADGLSDMASEAIDAYRRSLAEQGVVLVDLREVVEWLRNEDATWRTWSRAPDALERRFGSVSDGD